MFASIRAGLVHAWNDYPLRLLGINAVALTLLINGPFAVSIPVLSATRFSGGAAAFGTIMSAYGGGALLGMVLSSVLPKPPPRRTVATLLVVFGCQGIAGALIKLNPTLFLLVIGELMTALALLATLICLRHEQDME